MFNVVFLVLLQRIRIIVDFFFFKELDMCCCHIYFGASVKLTVEQLVAEEFVARVIW